MNSQTPLNRARYRKVVWYFAGVFLHFIWWDLLLRKIPFIKGYAQRTATERWQNIACQFRTLALEMGGVLIKLGQFLSIRVDVLPIEITSALKDLQDEVPSESIDKVLNLIEADFGRPINQIYRYFSPTPLAAASLAQTHEATLLNGQEAVVKVQRPGIDVLVKTDLASIAVALKWLKLYRRVSKRVNLDWLSEEFIRVTMNELDFVREAESAERFAKDFADEPAVYVPQIYHDYCTRRVLTMENVAYIRISDVKAIDAAGINQAELAKKLYDIYMHQVFVTHFVHADPHPGNLFVRPVAGAMGLAPGSDVPPFQIIFVDFGMVAIIPERLWTALRNYAIGLGTKDAHLMVQSYIEAGSLLPGADIKRLEEAHEAMFDRFWGVGMGQMHSVAMSEAPQLLEEYRDLIYETPFQVQVDLLFAARAVGLLAGVTTSLDSNFDPWARTLPFAERLAKEEVQKNWQGWPLELANILRTGFTLPTRLDRVLTKAQRGTLSYETSLASDARKTIKQLEKSVHRLTWAVGSVGLLAVGTALRIAEQPNPFNTGMIVVAGVIFFWKVMLAR